MYSSARGLLAWLAGISISLMPIRPDGAGEPAVAAWLTPGAALTTTARARKLSAMTARRWRNIMMSPGQAMEMWIGREMRQPRVHAGGVVPGGRLLSVRRWNG